MPYTPPVFASLEDISVEQFRRVVEAEFQRVAEALAEQTEVELRPIGAEPQKPRSGMVAYADGTNWDPGSGEGLYVYTIAGAWEKVGSGSGDGMELWTPVLAFQTPGDSNFVYSLQTGNLIKIGRLVAFSFSVTATVTHSTAAGALAITGLPYAASVAANHFWGGGGTWSGINKAGYTDIAATNESGTATIVLKASGNAQPVLNVTAADIASGNQVTLLFSNFYLAGS